MLDYNNSNDIFEFLKKFWDSIKKIFVKIFSFIKNIGNWFRERYQRLKSKRPNLKAITLKIEKDLKSGNYSTMDIGLESNCAIVNTFYDEDTKEIILDETQRLECDELDGETIRAFGDKEMLVLG